MSWSVTALLTMTLISGADVFVPAFELQEDIFNIHRDIANTLLTVINKLQFIVKRFRFSLSVVS